MRKFALVMAATISSLGIAIPATAHPDDGYQSQHDYDHDQLNREHDDGHDYLDDVHREAHEEGLTYWEHQRLHRDLNREHKREHSDLRREHRAEHRQNEWNAWNSGWSRDRYYDGY
ncbi:hypothetical protein [Sphingobium sp.]|uniref:hypothetical protein n=1 Tax=Sphingobium sp. TaxID=1912891 RepID=UPI002E20FFFE